MAHEVEDPKKQRAHVFVWLHAVYAQGNSLPTRAHALAAALVIHADADGTSCFPGVSHLAKHLNMSRYTVYRAVDDLKAAGLLDESWDDEEERRLWNLVVPKGAVTSCRKDAGEQAPDVAAVQQGVAPVQQPCSTSAHIPTQVPTHEPAQDLADARSSGEPESAVPEIAQYDRDEAAIEANVDGFRDDGEGLCAADMLQRGESPQYIVNTILKRRRSQQHEDEEHSVDALDAEPPPEGFEPPPEADALPPDDVDQAAAILGFRQSCDWSNENVEPVGEDAVATLASALAMPA